MGGIALSDSNEAIDRARLLLTAGEHESAERGLAALIVEHSQDAWFMRLLAHLPQEQVRPEEARALLEAAIESTSDASLKCRSQAWMQYEAGDYDASVRTAEAVLAADPADPGARLIVGCARSAQRRFREAMRALRPVVFSPRAPGPARRVYAAALIGRFWLLLILWIGGMTYAGFALARSGHVALGAAALVAVGALMIGAALVKGRRGLAATAAVWTVSSLGVCVYRLVESWSS